MQNDNSSSTSFINAVPNNRAMYDRIVMVPSTNYQTQVSLTSTMDSTILGQRQPIEHPHDKPQNMNEQTCQIPNGRNMNMNKAFEHLSMRTPSEHQSAYEDRSVLPSNNGKYGMTAIEKSQQRVQEWQNEESFVINGQLTDYYSELTNEDSSSRKSGYGPDSDLSDDDGSGLQKSMTGIQSPPDVNDSLCSRKNSSGSQSSLDSSLSFHTVYPSDNYPHKTHRQMQVERNKPAPQQQNSAAGRLSSTEPHHSTSTRPPATSSTEQYFGRSQSQPGPSGYRHPSGQSGVRRINQAADVASRQDVEQKRTSVFITYAEERENSNFKKLVLQLTRTLLSNGIQVRLDMLESTLISMSVSSWLDDNIQKCDFVVICVSPSYKSEVEQHLLSETPDPHSLHTRYIYNRLLSEYIQKGCRNYRFIPVLIGGATRRDLPGLCQDTTVYEWPKHFEAIIYRLFKKEKYIQPTVGPPPKVTVETYQSQDERLSNI